MMENRILTLVKSISVLFFDRMAEDSAEEVKEELKDILANIKIDSRNTSMGNEEAVVEALKYTAEWMLEADEEVEFSRENIVQRLSMNVNGDSYYINLVHESLDSKITAIDARMRVIEIMSELRFEAKQQKIKKMIAEANKAINFNAEYIDPTSYVRNLVVQLEEVSIAGKGQVPGLIGFLDFDEEEMIERALEKTAEGYSTEGLLKTGYRGLDTSTGVGGLRRGEMINYGALTHNYKSGMLLDNALYIPQFNDPYMWDERKRPLIVRISFDNNISQDIGIIYKKLHEIKYQEKLNKSVINIVKAKSEIIKHYGQRGYHFKLYSIDPSNYSIFDLFNLLTNLIQEGNEIHYLCIDYLHLISHNTPGDRLDMKIQRTIEMVRNYCFPRGITVGNAHQLSTKAQELARENPTTFTKKVNSGGWYMDCQSLHTKLDLEYVQHIIDHIDGNRYLMMSRGKHRGGEDTPEAHKHFLMKFETFGGLVPDYDKTDAILRSLPKVNSVDDLYGVDDEA